MNRDDDDLEAETTRLVSKESVEAAASRRDRACLIVVAGTNVGETYRIAKAEVVIGRDASADIRIPDDGISRRHAMIRLDNGLIVLEDLGSRNGTVANGQRIARHLLRDGDKIQLGSGTILKFTYHDDLDELFQQQMYDSALRDGLTRAYNKKYFLDRLSTEFHFAARHQTPLSLILFDIDHFKQVNDRYGHLAGDHVLSALAQLVHQAIRHEDIFARYGGEEFGLICRAIAPRDAAVLAERLREAVARTEFRTDAGRIPVTLSLGVAGLPDLKLADSTALIRAADCALYACKRGGRNQVRIASTDRPATTSTRPLSAVSAPAPPVATRDDSKR